MSKNPIYLDYAATTPMDPAVFDAMKPYVMEVQSADKKAQAGLWGNPGSLHSFGQQASAAVFTARQMIAKELGCRYDEIIFTGSATEANNLALRGAVEYWKSKNPGKTPRVVLPETEHDCVHNTAKGAREHGAEIVYIPVSKEGIIDLKKLEFALNERTVIVSVMYANNEIGVIQPIREIARLIQDSKLRTQNSFYPLLHTDAVQAFEYLPCEVDELGVDLMTISGHKIYGPKGVGALYVKKSQSAGGKSHALKPIIFGGGQEEGLRSGTENVPAIVGFAKAVSLSVMGREDEAVRIKKLRDQLYVGLKKIFPKLLVNGPAIVGSRLAIDRLPNHVSFYIPGRHVDELLMALDLHGVIASSGSACSARSTEPSRVLLALGYGKERAKNSIRLTLGRQTTARDIKQVLKIFTLLK